MKNIILILSIMLCSMQALAQKPATPVPTTFFGMIECAGNPAGNFPTVSFGNYGKESAAEWGWIEPSAPTGSGCPGVVKCTHTYNWATLDQYVSTAAAHNLPFMFTYVEAPPWATNSVGCNGNEPNQCTGPVTDTADFDAFITALATRYDGGHGHGLISAYEVNNETDYTGSMAQLAAQTDRLVTDVHAANPSALIVGLGFAEPDRYYQPGGLFDQFWSAWKAINPEAHFDALTFHGYPHPNNPVPEVIVGPPIESEPCGLLGYAGCVQAAITRNGLPSDTPLWDTEGSFGCNQNQDGCGSSQNNPLLSSDQQVAFIGRFELLNWSAGVSRQNWYAWDGVAWGNLVGTPNATAYQQVYNWMVGRTMATPCSVNGTVWTCGLTGTGGYSAQAVWNTAGNSTYTVPNSFTQYRDLAGNTTYIFPGSSVTIGTQPLLLEVPGAQPPSPPTNLSAVVR